MAENNQNIDNFLKDSLGQFQGITTQEDWAIIERKLDKRRTKKIGFWFSFVFLLLSLGSFMAYTIHQNNTIPIVEQNPSELNSNTTQGEGINNAPSNSAELDKPNMDGVAPTIASQDISENDDYRSDKHRLRSTESHKHVVGESDPYPFSVKQDNPISYNNSVGNENEEIVTTAADQVDPEIGKENVTDNQDLASSENAEPNQSSAATDKELKNLPIASPNNSPNASKKPKGGMDPSKSRTSNWEFGISVNPSIAGKWLKPSEQLGGLIHKDLGKIQTEQETNLPTSNFGINMQYQFQSGLFVRSGINYAIRAQRTIYNYDVAWAPVIDTPKNVITNYIPVGPSEVRYSGSISYHFIEVPLGIGYKLPISDKLNLRNEVGASYWRMIHREGKAPNVTVLELEDISSRNNYKQNSIAAYVKTGLFLDLEHASFGVEPSFTWSLNGITNDNSAQVIKPFNYGLNLTANYRLFK